MKDTITIEICTGTACFVMGGSELLLIGEHLPPEMKHRIRVVGAMCMDLCECESCARAPFVRINGDVVKNAAIPTVLGYLRELEKQEGEVSQDDCM